MCRKRFAWDLAQKKKKQHSTNFEAVGQWQPKGAKKARKDVSKGDLSGPCWTKRRKGQRVPKVALQFGVWEVGIWRDDC